MTKLLISLLFASHSVWACTAFLEKDGSRRLVGKNFDWEYGHGVIIVNKRDVEKAAVTIVDTDIPLLWRSKYGSITFNQAGREFPYGGMNEKGLVIEILWLNQTQYPNLVPGVQTVNETQWIQTMLDRASTLDEMEGFAKEFQLRAGYAKVHYFACENSGACAIFEYLDGKLIRNSAEKVRVVTNDPYRWSLKQLTLFKGFGGRQNIPQGPESLSRFLKAMTMTSKTPSGSLLDQTFDILDRVKNPKLTQWSIVYDQSLKQIYFKTRGRSDVRQVNLKYFDFSCATPVKTLNLEDQHHGDVSQSFQDYREDENTRIIEKSEFLPAKFWKLLETAPKADHCG